ncbi:MAG TPA: hypothetical protein VLE23_10450 [Geminicoccaceae bacterium]|nr:hypothetical protein [Geminicoccaceae bacterium]
MPAAPSIFVNGDPVLEDCDEDVLVVELPLTVSWEPITLSHPEIGSPLSDPGIEVVRYELVVEREESAPLKFTVELGPDVTEVALPSDLAEPGDAFKVEVLVREVSGNQTATESCFEVAAE